MFGFPWTQVGSEENKENLMVTLNVQNAMIVANVLIAVKNVKLTALIKTSSLVTQLHGVLFVKMIPVELWKIAKTRLSVLNAKLISAEIVKLVRDSAEVVRNVKLVSLARIVQIVLIVPNVRLVCVKLPLIVEELLNA